jgi:chromosome segregation ATPase
MNRLITVLAISFIGFPSTMAQAPPDGTIQALLAEVRQLRLALEKSTSVVPRIQLALQRIQTQQNSVQRAAQQLDGLRDRLAASASHQAAQASRLKAIEAEVGREQDLLRRTALENELKQLKMVNDQPQEEELQLRTREVELSGRLRAEQAKLDELNESLAALERMLDGPLLK